MAARCAVDGCGRPVVGWGWCTVHYRRWKRHGDPLVNLRPRIDPNGVCRIEGCGRPIFRATYQLCLSHYGRWRYANRHAGSQGAAGG